MRRPSPKTSSASVRRAVMTATSTISAPASPRRDPRRPESCGTPRSRAADNTTRRPPVFASNDGANGPRARCRRIGAELPGAPQQRLPLLLASGEMPTLPTAAAVTMTGWRRPSKAPAGSGSQVLSSRSSTRSASTTSSRARRSSAIVVPPTVTRMRAPARRFIDTRTPDPENKKPLQPVRVKRLRVVLASAWWSAERRPFTVAGIKPPPGREHADPERPAGVAGRHKDRERVGRGVGHGKEVRRRYQSGPWAVKAQGHTRWTMTRSARYNRCALKRPAVDSSRGSIPMPCRTLVPAVVLAALSVFGTSASSGRMPVDEIRPGMVGVGRTVFEGDRIEEFKVHFVGVLRNVLGPSQTSYSPSSKVGRSPRLA